MRVEIDGVVYAFDAAEYQYADVHKGWDRYGNGSISLYSAITPLMVMRKANFQSSKAATLARINKNKAINLNEAIENDCRLDIVTFDDALGREAVCNSMAFLCQVVLRSLNLSDGYHISATNEGLTIDFNDKAFTEAILVKMKHLIRAKLPFELFVMPKYSAEEILRHNNQLEAVVGLEQFDEDDVVELCRLQQCFEISRRYYVPTTGWFAPCLVESNKQDGAIVVSV